MFWKSSALYIYIYVLEGYSVFSKLVSCCFVVLPILVVNFYSPRYAVEAHSSAAYVLDAYTLLCSTTSTVHICSQSLQSVLEYSPGNRCTYTQKCMIPQP